MKKKGKKLKKNINTSKTSVINQANELFQEMTKKPEHNTKNIRKLCDLVKTNEKQTEVASIYAKGLFKDMSERVEHCMENLTELNILRHSFKNSEEIAYFFAKGLVIDMIARYEKRKQNLKELEALSKDFPLSLRIKEINQLMQGFFI